MGDEIEVWNKSQNRTPLILKHCILPEEGKPDFIMLSRAKGPPTQAEGAGKAPPCSIYATTPNQILQPSGGPVLVLGLEDGMENVSEDELPGR